MRKRNRLEPTGQALGQSPPDQPIPVGREQVDDPAAVADAVSGGERPDDGQPLRFRRVGAGGMRQDDHQRAGVCGPCLGERGHSERRRRSPGSADRAAMPLAEAGDHVGEPAVRIQCCGQAEQPPGGPFHALCHGPS